jgi:glycosyltransferase involved in cell wall biosynthesis
MKISVVTPCFNGARFIEACIQSVLAQRYPNLEYLIMDGGSTDGTVEIIHRYADQLAYWVSEPDAGHYDAVNKGFALATGEVMCFINSDDMLAPGSLAAVAEIFTQFPEISWITGMPTICNETGAMIEVVDPLPVYGQRYLANGEHDARILRGIQQESCFWRRSLWEAVGGKIDTQWDLAGDFDLWTRMAKHAQLVGVEMTLSVNRRHPRQRSALQMDEYRRQMDAISARLPCRRWLRSKVVQRLCRLRGGWRTYGLFFPESGAILTRQHGQQERWQKSFHRVLCQ